MNLNDLNRLIQWKVYDVLEIQARYKRGEATMQTELRIELRVDCEAEKLEELTNCGLRLARQWLATAKLSKEKVEPAIALITNDFWFGVKEIGLYDDVKKGENTDTDELLEAFNDQTL